MSPKMIPLLILSNHLKCKTSFISWTKAGSGPGIVSDLPTYAQLSEKTGCGTVFTAWFSVTQKRRPTDEQKAGINL